MDWSTSIAWFKPALTPIVVIAGLAYLLRKTLVHYVSGRITAKFDERIARFQHDLRANEKEMEAVRGHLLQAIASESGALASKRVDSIEKIWKCHCDNKFYRPFVSLLSNTNIEEIDSRIGEEKARKFVASIVSLLKVDPNKVSLSSGYGEEFRPFLSRQVWSYYSIYQTVTLHSLAVWLCWNAGLSSKESLKNDDMLKAVVTMMPEHEKHLQERGLSGAFGLIDYIEERLISAIEDMAQGKEADVSVKQRAQKAIELIQAHSRQLFDTEAQLRKQKAFQ